MHCSPAAQVVPQPPQLNGSLVMSTQLPPHWRWVSGSGQVSTISRHSLSEPQVCPVGHSAVVAPTVLHGSCEVVLGSVQAAETRATVRTRLRRFMVPRSEVPEGDGADGEGDRHADQDVGDVL